MLAYYGFFVLYIILYDRFSSTAMHIEESHQYQEAFYRATQEHNALAGTHSGQSTHGRVSAGVQPLAPNLPSIRSQVLLGDAPSPPPDSPAVCTARRNDTADAAHTAARRFVRSNTLDPHVFVHGSTSSGSDSSEPLLGRSRSLPWSDTSEMVANWGARLQAPIVGLLHLTMPAVGLADTVRYPRAYAVLLPVVSPLFVVVAKGLALRSASPLNFDALLYGLLCSLFSSAVIFSIYPSDGRHYGILSGFFTTLTFGMSILWMDIAAGEMVRAWKCLGFIHGLSQAMLGVTVLAWANSFGDAVANSAMARDGFPSMAVAACFASPLFTLIAGLGSAFTIAIAVHGDLQFQVAMPMRVALGFAFASILRYIVLVPTLHRWRLSRWTAYSMLAFYVVFQVVYLVVTAQQTDR